MLKNQSRGHFLSRCIIKSQTNFVIDPRLSPGLDPHTAPCATDRFTTGRALGQTIRRLSRQRTARQPLDRIRPTGAACVPRLLSATPHGSERDDLRRAARGQTAGSPLCSSPAPGRFLPGLARRRLPAGQHQADGEPVPQTQRPAGLFQAGKIAEKALGRGGELAHWLWRGHRQPECGGRAGEQPACFPIWSCRRPHIKQDE